MFSRFLPVFGALVLLCSCATAPKDPYIDCNSEFSRIVSTDFKGAVIAEWIGAGKISYDKDDSSYNFLAVQKVDHGRTVVTRRYVIGRPVKVIAPNVAVHPVEAPDWICRDGVLVTTTGFSK